MSSNDSGYLSPRHLFPRHADGRLFVENIALEQLAQQYGTPAYVYSLAQLRQNFLAWSDAVSDRGLVCYAVKANSNLGILNVLAKLGSGFDIVSIGELQRVLKAGGSASKTIFSGVGKSRSDIEQALAAKILCFNVESEPELHLINQVAGEMQTSAPISIRVNPDVDAQTHPYISTGLRNNKFGVDAGTALRMYADAQSMPHIDIKGIDCHIGSQLTSIEPLLDSLRALLNLVDQLQAIGIELEHIDLGGGLGVNYQGEQPPTPAQYLNEVKILMQSRKQQLIFEPGRSIVASAGVLLTRVQYLKNNSGHNFAIVDAAMNDYIRPALYQAWSNISVASSVSATTKTQTWDIVGPVCESADFLGKQRELPLAEDSLLCLHDCGAYGFCMSSNYNTRPRAAEIIVDGDQSYLVRHRENIDDLFKDEQLLPLNIT